MSHLLLKLFHHHLEECNIKFSQNKPMIIENSFQLLSFTNGLTMTFPFRPTSRQDYSCSTSKRIIRHRGLQKLDGRAWKRAGLCSVVTLRQTRRMTVVADCSELQGLGLTSGAHHCRLLMRAAQAGPCGLTQPAIGVVKEPETFNCYC